MVGDELGIMNVGFGMSGTGFCHGFDVECEYDHAVEGDKR